MSELRHMRACLNCGLKFEGEPGSNCPDCQLTDLKTDMQRWAELNRIAIEAEARREYEALAAEVRRLLTVRPAAESAPERIGPREQGEWATPDQFPVIVKVLQGKP